ncbi:MAG: FtsX-like permease family protein, partial [Candidatus Thorarchaeota archaeon]
MFLGSRLISKSPQLITTFLIFSLSAGVLGGIIFFMDSSAPSVLDDLREDVPFDMEISVSSSFYRQNTTTMDDIIDVISEEELIQQVETLNVITSDFYDYETYEYTENTYLGVGSTFFDSFPKAVQLESEFPNLNDTSCYLLRETLELSGLAIGDNYTPIVTYYDEFWNEIRINSTFKIIGTFESEIFMQNIWYYEQGRTAVTTLRMITTEQGLIDAFGVIGFGDWDSIRERIWTSFDIETLLEYDTAVVTEELDNIRKYIEQNTLPFGYVSEFRLLNSIAQYSAWASSMTGIALAFSVPSIIMGVMLIYYNSTLLADERRKDIGILKTRGASGWQAFTWILSSAIITGFVGSLGAVLTGGLAALLSGTVKTFLVFDLAQLESLTLLLTPEAILVVFIFSFSVGIAVALPISIKALIMSATEAHSILERDVILAQENLGSPLIELAGLGISGYILVPMIMLVGMMSNYGIVSPSFFIMLIALLAVFIISFARLLSRPSSSIKSSLLSRFKKPQYLTGTRIMSRTAGLFRKSEAMGVMFIAMVFTAGVFASVSATTGYNHMVEVYNFEVGGDIAIEVTSGLENVTIDLIANLTQVQGVTQSCAILSFIGEIHYWATDYGPSGGREFVNTTTTIYAVQPAEWAEVGFWLPYFTKDTLPADALNLMADDYTNVLASFKPIDRYAISGYMRTPVYGDQIEVALKTEDWTNTSDHTIVDVLAASESGYDVAYLPGESNKRDFIVMDIDYVHDCLNTTKVTKFIVKLEDGANLTSVMTELWQVAPFSFSSIDSTDIQIEEALSSKGAQSIYGVYTLNVIFSTIYLTLGMLIVSSVRVRKMRKQFSVLRALGTEPKSIIAAVLMDTTIGLLIALGIGGALGLILSGFALNMPLV